MMYDVRRKMGDEDNDESDLTWQVPASLLGSSVQIILSVMWRYTCKQAFLVIISKSTSSKSFDALPAIKC